MAELADAPDSKSGGLHWPCGFDPLFRHQTPEQDRWEFASLGSVQRTPSGIAGWVFHRHRKVITRNRRR